jgi:hypothetical protein
LDEYLSVVDEYRVRHGVPAAVNEFGVARWVPGGAQFMDDQMGLLEQRGINYALWSWDPAWAPWVKEVNAFNFRCGPKPSRCEEDAANELRDVIVKYWARNTVRPSTLPEKPVGLR